MSEQHQGTWQGWTGGAIVGLAVGLILAIHCNSEVSPTQEVAQWVEAGFSEEESRILVAYGRTKLLPNEIRRLAQDGAPDEATNGNQAKRAATQRQAPAPPPTTSPAAPRTNPAATRARLLQGCQALQAGKHTTAESWFTAMRSQGNPWSALANRVQTEIPPEQQIPALKDAWRRLCAVRQPQ